LRGGGPQEVHAILVGEDDDKKWEKEVSKGYGGAAGGLGPEKRGGGGPGERGRKVGLREERAQGVCFIFKILFSLLKTIL
jgi:hypothetical protein